MRIHACLIATAISCALLPAHAEDGPTRAEFDALVQRVQSLEQRLDVQQKQTAASATTTIPALPKEQPSLAQEPAQWQKLEPGMSTAQVLQYLGNPDRKMVINGHALWYYETSRGVGSVLFTVDDKLSSSQEPPRW